MVAVLVLGAGTPSRADAQLASDPVVRQAISAYEAGELVRALALLDSVPSSLPAGDGAVRRLYRGLIQFAFGAIEVAHEEFAMAVRLDPAVRLNPSTHSPSRIEAFEAARAAVVAEWAEQAAAAEADGELALAARRWHSVLLAAPEDARAQARMMAVNQALSPVAGAGAETSVREAVRDSAGGAAVDSAVAAPGAADPVTGTETVQPAAPPPASAEAALLPTYSPGQAAFLGMIFPGLGEFYTGRAVRGGLIMAAAAGAITAGILVERVELRCLSVPVDDFCPPEDQLREEIERPYLVPALGAAAVLTVVGAIDAYVSARRANERAADAAAGRPVGFAPRLELPTVTTTGDAVRVALLRVRF